MTRTHTELPEKSKKQICFCPEEFRGSRGRCLLSTHRSRAQVADFFSALAPDDASVKEGDRWAPNGFLEPAEAKLGETVGFLDDERRERIAAWWLVNRRGANTPNWDLTSTCDYRGRRGLILVEAKAHEGECSDDRCTSGNIENIARIREALGTATLGWNRLLSGFALSADSHFQLSNRFAFAWKVAEMGTPVVLVYLGFLDAWDMSGSSRRLLQSHRQWKDWVLKMSTAQVPNDVWNRTFDVNGTPLTVSIRSARVEIAAEVVDEGAQ